jgi:hypothetical protein
MTTHRRDDPHPPGELQPPLLFLCDATSVRPALQLRVCAKRFQPRPPAGVANGRDPTEVVRRRQASSAVKPSRQDA